MDNETAAPINKKAIKPAFFYQVKNLPLDSSSSENDSFVLNACRVIPSEKPLSISFMRRDAELWWLDLKLEAEP